MFLLTVPAQAEPEAPARANRLAVSLGFGVGSADLDGVQALADDMSAALEAQNAGLEVDGSASSGLQIHAGFGVRTYLPWYLLLEVGYATLYSGASAGYTFGPASGEVKSYSLVMELPISVGGHVPLGERVYLYGAAGPTVFWYSRSLWDATHGSLPDGEADGGVGFHALAGADFMVASSVAFGLEARWRGGMKSGDLRERNSGATLTSGALRGDGSTDTYAVDFSGVSATLQLRVFAR